MINFVNNVFEYNIEVENNVKKLDLLYKANNEKATIQVEGNENFIVGQKNAVKIIVTAENGETQTYTINVLRKM